MTRLLKYSLIPSLIPSVWNTVCAKIGCVACIFNVPPLKLVCQRHPSCNTLDEAPPPISRKFISHVYFPLSAAAGHLSAKLFLVEVRGPPTTCANSTHVRTITFIHVRACTFVGGSTGSARSRDGCSSKLSSAQHK